MGVQMKPNAGSAMLAEMKEFASFPKAAQRYIRRSLDIGLGRRDALRRWARNVAEGAGIRDQARAYRRLEAIRAAVPDDADIERMEGLMGPLRALLQSISSAAVTAPGWSNRKPAFYPEWVEKVDLVPPPSAAEDAPEGDEAV